MVMQADPKILEKFHKLEQYDTPTITNVVATYPERADACLGLYHPWAINWYTDTSIRCQFPELGPRAGYAITVVYSQADPQYNRLSFGDLLKAIEDSPKPVVLVVKQNLPEEIKQKNGLFGGNMVTAIHTLGCVGLVSDGPSRDINEIRDLGFQYMLPGVCAGHGWFGIQAINVPVSVGGMDVAPGEIIHMDENGACKFPGNQLDSVLSLCEKLSEDETSKMARMRQCTTAAEIASILNGFEEMPHLRAEKADL